MNIEDIELIKKVMLNYRLRNDGNFSDNLKSIECDENFMEHFRHIIDIQEEAFSAQKKKVEDKIILRQKTKEFLSALGIDSLKSCSCTGENILTVRGEDLYELLNDEIKLKELTTKLKLKMFW